MAAVPPSAPPAVTSWNDAMLEQWLGSGRPAVVTAGDVWTGDELVHRAGGAASWLHEIGIPAGAVVPALLDESPAAIALATGAALSGRALAPLGTKLPPADLAAAVAALGATHLVAEPATHEVAANVARRTGAAVHLLDGPPAPSAVPDARAGPDDVALVVHTSGTEGLPKPILARHGPMLARLAVYSAAIELGPGDRYCSASPFHHTAGVAMTFTALGVGAAVIPQAGFDPAKWALAGRLGATCALLVPTMIDILLAERSLARMTPRVLQYGAAPIHPETLRAAMATLPDTRFVQIFGQTEVSPMTALTHADHVRALDDAPALLTTVGRALPGVELRVEGADDEGVGELTVRAAHAFTYDDDGWRRTGDLGSLDDSGYLTLRGRANDRIVRGGENIYPVEVERALASHPGVREVAVVGVPDRRWGEVVKAVVVLDDDVPAPSPPELVAHTRERVAHFKVPAILEFAPALPRNAAGKVLRRKLVDG